MYKQTNFFSVKVFLILLLFSFFGCLELDGKGDGGKDKSACVFDLSGAKAFATIEGSSKRSDAQDAAGLVKIMEDGSVESILQVPENDLPEIQFIAVSPVVNEDGSRDLFISFAWSFTIWEDSIYNEETGEYTDGGVTSFGDFVHVKADGSYTTIMDGDNGAVNIWSWSGMDDYKPLVFDKDGNIYFSYVDWSYNNSTQIIYKYDIYTDDVTPVTPIIEGYNYESFEIDSSGEHLFVKGSRYANGSESYFFRMINTDDVSSFVNIYYCSNSYDTYVRGFKLSSDGKSLIINGTNVRGMSGVIKVDIVSDSELSYTLLYDSTAENDSWNFPIYDSWYDEWSDKTYKTGLFEDNGSGEYVWADHWYTDQDSSSATLDYERVYEYISSFYVEEIAFFYNGKSGAEALADVLVEAPYTYEEILGTSNDDEFALLNTFVVDAVDTTSSAKTFADFKTENDISWLYFDQIGNLFYDSEGQLWGILGGGNWNSSTDPKPIKLLDSDGNRDLEIINAFKDNEYKPVGFSVNNDTLYFRDAITDMDGYETGNHKLYRFALADSENVEDLLVNVPENGNMEILDFSAGSDYLYFTSVSGINVICGKVDLKTLEYSSIDVEQRLSNIEVYE